MSVPTGWYKPVGINKEDREFHDTPDLRGAKENGSNPGLIKRFRPPSAKLNRQLKIGTYWVRTRINLLRRNDMRTLLIALMLALEGAFGQAQTPGIQPTQQAPLPAQIAHHATDQSMRHTQHA